MTKEIYDEFNLQIARAKVAGEDDKVTKLAEMVANRALHGRGLTKEEAKSILGGTSLYNSAIFSDVECILEYLRNRMVAGTREKSYQYLEMMVRVGNASVSIQ